MRATAKLSAKCMSALLLCGVITFSCVFKSDAQSFSFAAVADPFTNMDSWRRALSEIRDMNVAATPSFSPASFILFGGNGEPAYETYKTFKQVFSNTSTRPVFLPVVGEEDNFNETHIDYYVFRDSIIKNLPVTRRDPLGCSYYYDYQNVRVIVVDAYQELGGWGCMNKTGIKWVEDMIVAAPSNIDHVFIGFNGTAFPRFRNIYTSYNSCIEYRNFLWNMLVAHNDLVRAVFNGHTGYYYRMRVKDPAGRDANDIFKFPDEIGGVYQVECGSTGDPNGDGKNTIVQVQIDGKKVTFRVVQAPVSTTDPFTVVDTWEIQGATGLASFSGVVVGPKDATVCIGEKLQLSATAIDQFGVVLQSPPQSFTWTVSGGQGTVNADGLFTAGNSVGVCTVRAEASSGGSTKSGTLQVQVVNSQRLIGTIIGNGGPFPFSSAWYWTALDGSTNTFPDIASVDNLYVGYDFGKTRYDIQKLRYWPRPGFADRMLNKTFEVSQDGITWTVIHTISEVPPEGQFTVVVLPSPVTTSMIRYNGTGGFLNVCEIEFWGRSNASSSIRDRRSFYELSRTKVPGNTPVEVYDLSGRLIGFHSAQSAGATERQRIAGNGVYITRLVAQSSAENAPHSVKRTVLIR